MTAAVRASSPPISPPHAGLELPALSAGLSQRLKAIAETVITDNPVDLAGSGEQDFRNFERVTAAVLESGEVDAVLLTGYFGGYSQMNEEFRARETEVAHEIAAAARASGRTARRAGDVLELVARAGAAGGRRARLSRYRGSARDARAARRAGATAAARRAGRGGGGRARRRGAATSRRASCSRRRASRSRRRCRATADAEAVAAAAGRSAIPVALKALGLLHKSDSGVSRSGSPARARCSTHSPTCAARLDPDGFSVEAMADVAGGVELIVGCRRDPRFGPIVLVGLGGIYAELLHDVAVALAPAGADELEELLLSLRRRRRAHRRPRPCAARRARGGRGSRCALARRCGASRDRRDRDQPAARRRATAASASTRASCRGLERSHGGVVLAGASGAIRGGRAERRCEMWSWIVIVVLYVLGSGSSTSWAGSVQQPRR